MEIREKRTVDPIQFATELVQDIARLTATIDISRKERAKKKVLLFRAMHELGKSPEAVKNVIAEAQKSAKLKKPVPTTTEEVTTSEPDPLKAEMEKMYKAALALVKQRGAIFGRPLYRASIERMRPDLLPYFDEVVPQ